MVSPVWLQIKRKPSGTFYMAGTHDVDHDWVREVRKRGKRSQIKSNAKDYDPYGSSSITLSPNCASWGIYHICFSLVIPRILFDGWSSDDFYSLFTTGSEPKELIKTIITSAKVTAELNIICNY